MIAIEIGGLEEQEHSPACLLAHGRRLIRLVRPRQQKRRPTRARRLHHDPALAPAHVDVVGQFEAKASREPVDRLVIVTHKKGEFGDLHQAISLTTGREYCRPHPPT